MLQHVLQHIITTTYLFSIMDIFLNREKLHRDF